MWHNKTRNERGRRRRGLPTRKNKQEEEEEEEGRISSQKQERHGKDNGEEIQGQVMRGREGEREGRKDKRHCSI